jgi:hypothetical protein
VDWIGYWLDWFISPIDTLLRPGSVAAIIRNPASFGIGILLLMILVKILLTTTSFAEADVHEQWMNTNLKGRFYNNNQQNTFKEYNIYLTCDAKGRYR